MSNTTQIIKSNKYFVFLFKHKLPLSISVNPLHIIFKKPLFGSMLKILRRSFKSNLYKKVNIVHFFQSYKTYFAKVSKKDCTNLSLIFKRKSLKFKHQRLLSYLIENRKFQSHLSCYNHFTFNFFLKEILLFH